MRNLDESPERNLDESPMRNVNDDLINRELGEMTEYERAMNFGQNIRGNEEENLEIVRRNAMTEADLRCLTKFSGRESWLNNDIIMIYLAHVLPKIDPGVMILEIGIQSEGTGITGDFRKLFYPNFKEDWTKIVIVFIVNDNHWTLGIVDRNEKCDFYDSLGEEMMDGQKEFVRGIMIYLEKDAIEFNEVDSETYYQQNDSNSCGPAVCMLAERKLKGESLEFNGRDVSNWRRHAFKILKNEVLNTHNEEAEIVVEEVETQPKSSQKKSRKRKAKLSLKGEKLQQQSNKKKHLDSLSENQKDINRQKDQERKSTQRADPEKREAEYTQKNKSRNDKRATKKLKEKKKFIARTEIENEDDVLYFDIGDLTEECKHCGARFFKGEHVIGKKKGEYNKCCNFGKFELEDPFDDYPHELYNLLAKEHNYGRKKKNEDEDLSKLFHENPRNYNSAFAFASMKAPNQDRTTLPYAYRVQGQIYHTVNLAMHPDEDEDPSYAQLFYLDTEDAIKERMENNANKNCNERVMREIDQVLYNVNPYYDAFRMMSEVEKEVNDEAEKNGKAPPELKLVFDVNDVDKRRFNAPKANEVAAVFVLNENNEFLPAQKLAIHQHGKKLTTLTKFEKRAESMLYPIYFPTGKGGWETNMKKDVGKRKISLSEYYRYRTAIRMPSSLEMDKTRFDYAKEELYGRMIKEKEKFPINAHKWNKKYDDNFELKNFSPIRLGGKLYQQYLVDAYVKVEQDRLDFIKYNQKTLKAENYKALNDYLQTTADEQGKKVGKTVILPSSFKGSPRNCLQAYQDSMALVRRKGKPDLFITFTCNPTWPEILRNLHPGNKTKDEPDLIDRVFKLKLKELMLDIKEREIFGKVAGYTYVVEFQKRGLPHAHILLILDKDSKIRTPEEIDETVCAEIPDKEKFPRLHAIVTSNMIHGPCGALNMKCVCMEEDKDGKKKCCKDYPKEFREKTEAGNDSYANYRRRKDGETYELPNGTIIDNKWIVPYNKYLSLKYNAHINVEICASVKCVKYLYKYIYKGHDCARMVISINGNDEIVHDEVKRYVDMRYVTPHEAFWRIFDLDLDEKSHSITRLDLHLPDQQIVYYKPDEDIKKKLEKAETKHTTLTAWFELNKVNSDARDLYYHEIPEKFTFKKNDDDTNKIWAKKGGETGRINKPCIGRMYTAHPSQGELFYLRLLLLHVKGAQSWKDLLIVEEHECENFEEAARKMGLIEDEKEWENYFEEAVTYATAPKLREIFVSILNHGEKLNVKGLWEKFKEDMYEDFVYQKNSVERSEQLAKADIERQLQQTKKSLIDYGIELPNIEFEEEDFWDLEEERKVGNQMREQMNRRQRKVTNYVFEKIDQLKKGKLKNGCVYIDGPGGSGKTYTYRTLCHLFRAEGIKYRVARPVLPYSFCNFSAFPYSCF
jgi:flagellar biosynthesis GTPase FlhF